jgi:hypothetical protein|tara:strand:+ start:1113 stop:1850 length:738 start_codon:yes stop_codon:yes gene_type:complete
MTLQRHDLRDLVSEVLEIDSDKSKMGSDADIVTITFSTITKESAQDLTNFLERGYTFVLDADATSSEQTDGTYKVFVEIERDEQAGENIVELASGVKNLAAIEDFRFRYHKEFRSKNLTQQSLEEVMPLDPELYGVDNDVLTDMAESSLNNYKDFFSKSFVESIIMTGEKLTIQKKWSDPLQFKFVDYGPTLSTINNIKESFNANDFAEIIFLSKYIGDYNITKYGNKLTFDNEGSTLVLERVIV